LSEEARGDRLRRIQADLAAGALADARRAVDAWLAESPEDPDALYLSAVIHRYAGEPEAARGTLGLLKQLAPQLGRAHQEEGHLLRSLGQQDAALAAYGRATQLNPALEASFRAQLELLERQGRGAESEAVRARLAQLRRLPKPLVAVTDLLSEGKLLKAEDLCRRFLQRAPKHVEGMRLLADIGIRLGALDDAEFLLESALRFEPDHEGARIDYVQVLRKRQKFERALEEARRLLERNPADPRFRSIFAIECMQSGDYETALTAFDRVLESVPGDPVTLTSRGHALKTCGRSADAVASYREALANRPEHAEAWYSLANLKTYRFDGEERARMAALEADPNLTAQDRTYLHFALGKAHEDQEEYETAFRHYVAGNRIRRAESRYDAERMHDELRRTAEVCAPELFERHRGDGCPAPDPIFIVGLPRAGSTLLEQILASHSRVDGTLELPNVLSLVQQLRRRGPGNGAGAYPEVLNDLEGAELSAFGEAYLRDTRIHRAGAPFFTDKMPNNFRHVGLIKLMLPRAKIVDARRHPLACCTSGFKQLFAEGQEFTYDLTDLGRYYRDYVALMDHWDRVLPGAVLRVMHEDVVEDLEGQVRRLLDFCGLPFEEACLEFHRTERVVRTASSEQVRQPLYRTGVEDWEHFEPWLDPLKEALGPALERHPPPPRG
jgi:tetratricopeptide (TPR) repeat protein